MWLSVLLLGWGMCHVRGWQARGLVYMPCDMHLGDATRGHASLTTPMFAACRTSSSPWWPPAKPPPAWCRASPLWKVGYICGCGLGGRSVAGLGGTLYGWAGRPARPVAVLSAPGWAHPAAMGRAWRLLLCVRTPCCMSPPRRNMLAPRLARRLQDARASAPIIALLQFTPPVQGSAINPCCRRLPNHRVAEL